MNSVRIDYSEFERLMDSSLNYFSTEVDGYEVSVAMDDNVVHGVYYTRAGYGTKDTELSSKCFMGYVESDPHWPSDWK